MRFKWTRVCFPCWFRPFVQVWIDSSKPLRGPNYQTAAHFLRLFWSTTKQTLVLLVWIQTGLDTNQLQEIYILLNFMSHCWWASRWKSAFQCCQHYYSMYWLYWNRTWFTVFCLLMLLSPCCRSEHAEHPKSFSMRHTFADTVSKLGKSVLYELLLTFKMIFEFQLEHKCAWQKCKAQDLKSFFFL